MKKLKLMADYQCYPLWINSDDEVGNIDSNTLPISNILKDELNIWSDIYDETLNLNDPLNSGFVNHEKEIAFKEKGKYLRELLQAELGSDYEIIYQP